MCQGMEHQPARNLRRLPPMKRVLQHPPASETGRTYWRSLDEYSQTPEFQDWLGREFPAGASEFWGDGVSRRGFLRLMGASMALAGLGMSGCRRPESHLLTHTKTPEWSIPGKTLNYATCMPRRRGGAPLLVTSYQGRPVKIEGNPSHPAVQGKSDLRSQASVLDLYDPERAKRFTHEGKTSDRAAFLAAVDEALSKAGDGAGLAVLSESWGSPTTDRLAADLRKKYPQLTWCTYEPLDHGTAREAVRLAFGPGKTLRLNTAKARVILTLDADILGSQDGDLQSVRGFADGRKLADASTPMNRLYAVEGRFTTTGSCADHRLRVAASHVPAVAIALLRSLTGSGAAIQLPAGIDPAWIREAAADLKAAGSSALVVAGSGQSVAVHLAAAAINQALGALGSTVEVISAPTPESTPLADLTAKIRSSQIQTLFILGSNPVYNAPADLAWGEWLRSVPTVFRLGSHEDETGALSTWTAPLAHYLETWGDALLEDGSYGCVQPLILPLFNGISAAQLLARMLGLSAPAGKDLFEGPDLVQETFRARVGAAASDAAWLKFVRDGFWAGSATTADAAARVAPAALALLDQPIALPELSASSLEIVFVGDTSVDDGRHANNGWLQELPDPITKVTWDNAALVSPKTAKELGLYAKTENGIETTDIVRITVNGRTVEAPILVQPGHADHSFTLVLGYGRTAAGKVGNGVGYNAYSVRTSSSPSIATGATVEKTGKRFKFAITQEHWSMEGRDIVREAPLEHYKAHPDFAFSQGLESHAKPTDQSFYKSPPFDYEKFHQWGMVIDLTSCTGCNTCVIACQAENNIPIVGKDQVAKGREMHWIRIDRYFSGASKFKTDNGKAELPNDPEMVMQPVTCMHCENAPCETVCPVNATVHNEEGLNVMAYNRCIGTRYCANNCPYKVRRFNFFDYNKRQIDSLYLGPLGPAGKPETIKMQKNPNVSVRMRGVIEKCTFCVQRLEDAKIVHKAKSRSQGEYDHLKLPTDSVKTACQQACPADAIIFGDLSDPASRVSKLKKTDRNYNLLDYLNVRPRLSYLARVRNPNPKMPGAELVGAALLQAGHGGGHESSHGGEHHAPAEGHSPASPESPVPAGQAHGHEGSH
ncbi:MAG: TAT-variant-translocated molybdopterin oxidoreductase [Candidatus Methylacidiphilales bacterium]|nr:TAT-variant-translocated molybdopterin oxidoreductase [Candidatus Methylacidiphilales bacterium]